MATTLGGLTALALVSPATAGTAVTKKPVCASESVKPPKLNGEAALGDQNAQSSANLEIGPGQEARPQALTQDGENPFADPFADDQGKKKDCKEPKPSVSPSESASASPSASSSDTPVSPSASAEVPALPVTGSSTILIATVAAGMLAIGAVLFMIARRRRFAFQS